MQIVIHWTEKPSLQQTYKEHTRYIKQNDSQSTYALRYKQ